VLNVFSQNFLCVISKVEKVGTLNRANINKVVNVGIYPFAENGNEAHSDMSTVLRGVEATLCDGFYFSYGYDMTASRQRRIAWMQKKSSDPI